MINNLNSILFASICFIIYTVYFSLQKRKNLKNGIYDISACPEDNATKYFLVIESKHGRYFDTRKLSKLSYFFIPNDVIHILKTTYNDYDSARKSLQEFRKKIK